MEARQLHAIFEDLEPKVIAKACTIPKSRELEKNVQLTTMLVVITMLKKISSIPPSAVSVGCILVALVFRHSLS